jgi:CRP-like cAMP-binding protein
MQDPETQEELRARIDALRRVGVFSDLPEQQLRWFAENTVERRFAAGEVIFERGARAEWMAVYLEGEAHVVGDENRLDDFVFIVRAGDPVTEVSGMLPYSRMTEFTYAVRAAAPTRMLLFPTSLFPAMLERMPVLAQRLVGVMSDRVREATKMDVQQDKLMALGKLSCGCAGTSYHSISAPSSRSSNTRPSHGKRRPRRSAHWSRAIAKTRSSPGSKGGAWREGGAWPHTSWRPQLTQSLSRRSYQEWARRR